MKQSDDFTQNDKRLEMNYSKSEIMEEKELVEEEELKDQKEETPKSKHSEENKYLNFKEYTPSTKYSLLKPHLISFFHHVYISSSKFYEDFTKFSNNITSYIKKEKNRLETLISYKLDYPEYLIGNLLKVLTKLVDIFRNEGLFSEEENKTDLNKFLEETKQFSQILMNLILKNCFDRDIVLPIIF